MKKTLLLTIFLSPFLLIGCTGNKEAQEQNMTYKEYKELYNEVGKLLEETNSFDIFYDYEQNTSSILNKFFDSQEEIRNTYESGNYEELEESINSAIEVSKNVISELENLGDIEGDSSLKDVRIRFVNKEIESYETLIKLVPYFIDESLVEKDNANYELIESEYEKINFEAEEIIEEESIIYNNMLQKYT